MSGFWLISYVILWLLVMSTGMVILALAREIEALHARLDALHKCLSRTDWGSNDREKGERVREAAEAQDFYA